MTITLPVPEDLEPRSLPIQLRAYAATALMVAAATVIGLAMQPKVGTSAIDLLYLIPVMAAASFFGLRPALAASLGSALAYNFFFTEPVHTFRIEDPRSIVTVAMLLAVALVTSHLASRMRLQARIAAAHASRNATVAGFARRLISCTSEEQVGRVVCGELAKLFGCNAAFLAPREAALGIVAQDPADAALNPNDVAAAAWVLEYGEAAGRGSPRLSPADWLFYPVASSARVLAVAGVARDDGKLPIPPERESLLTSLLDQAALALERVALAVEMLDVAQLRERDRLRGALLSSVGHDLRTPLTAILAASAELRCLAPQGNIPLIDAIEGEARRLERYIANLLDMARIEAGAIRLHVEPVDLVDAAAAAIHDLRTSLATHPVVTDIPPHLPLVRADPQLLHHCLINLLDNARRYSPAGSRILVSAALEAGGLSLAIADEGQGLPPEGEKGLFGRFSRLDGSDRKGGAGLGLAIVSGFAETMGLGVAASPRASTQGAVFTLHFPEGLLMVENSEIAQ